MAQNFLDLIGLSTFLDNLKTLFDVKPEQITWEAYQALTDEQRAGRHFKITGAPKTGLGAGDIGYDNTTSGLTADDVQEAIDEVSAKVNRGSVSVTADGVKTLSAILDELFALVDLTKLTEIATLSVQGSTTNNIYVLSQKTSTTIMFSRERVLGSNLAGMTAVLKTTASYHHTVTITPPSTIAITDNSSSVITAGEIYTINY